MRSDSFTRSSLAPADANAAAGVRRNRRQHRQFVDQLRRQRAAHLRRSQPFGRRRNLHRAHQLRVLLLEIQNRNVRAQRGQHVKQRGARGIQPHRIQNQIGTGKHERRAEEKCRRRKVAGNSRIDRVQRLRAGDRNRIQRARQRSAKGAQRQFAVIAGAHSFPHRRRSRRLQSRQQHAALHLRARNRRGVVDGLQRAALDCQWRVAFGQRQRARPWLRAACESAPWAAAKATRRRRA